MDEATANMLAELRLAGINFATDDQLRQAGVLHPAGAISQTAFGMPDLSILRGQGATPGIPLQHESVAQLPPWAAVARSLTPIGGVDVAARNLAEAEQAGDYGRGAAAVGQGVASALPVVGRMGRVAGAGYGALTGALPMLAGAPAEAQQAPAAPIDDGLTPEQRGRRVQLNKQLQRDGLPWEATRGVPTGSGHRPSSIACQSATPPSSGGRKL